MKRRNKKIDPSFKRVFGTSNPERTHNPHWEWMVRTCKDPFAMRQERGLPSNFPDNPKTHEPDWCFLRFGASRTYMPDGRIICIGGEHEDSYDPNFCIYNDVIVLRPGEGQSDVTEDTGSVEIYSYPESVFLPTDFHSATLVGEQIYIIGRLGYNEEPKFVCTPVYVLDVNTMEVREVHTTGDSPGWLHEHYAAYNSETHAIIVRGGKIASAHEKTAQNCAVHALDLDAMRWKKLADADNRQWFVIDSAVNTGRAIAPEIEDICNRITQYPCMASIDFGNAYMEHPVAFCVGDVRVWFEDCYPNLCVSIEGTLPAETLKSLLDALCGVIKELTGEHWFAKELDTMPENSWLVY